MKILHLSSGSIFGGAARGAYWLHKGMLKLGIDSYFVSNGIDAPNEDNLIKINNNPYDDIKFKLISKYSNSLKYIYPKQKGWLFNTGLGGFDIKKLTAFKEADIIHLHWINGMLSINQFKKINKPIVWTVRDMWPFTGGCHYSMGCKSYENNCGKCPQLGSNKSNDLSRYVYNLKLNSISRNIYPVGISNWISNSVKSSKIFKDFHVKTISNNIDTSIFSPICKDKAKLHLNFPKNKKIILIGANSITDFYKGFDLFIKALNKIESDNIHIVTFGKLIDLKINNRKFSFEHLGFIQDDKKLQILYSSADVFVAPSRYDAFGKTIAESMSCGTPVVCFDASGPADIVDHARTGYKASAYDEYDLAKGIDWILNIDDIRYKELCKQSRKRAISKYDSLIVAKEYNELYEEIMNM